MLKICILDYGSGNVKSVFNAFSTFASPIISNSSKEINNASHLVLPGVGSFVRSMSNIKDRIDVQDLKNQLQNGKPFLGICVGMQVLATVGHEFERTQGLGIVKGEVVSMLPHNELLPHVGWNSVKHQFSSKLFRNIPDGSDFYFVHSFKFEMEQQHIQLGVTDYGLPFTSAIADKNIFGVQFHPEKSQAHGLQLLRNFTEIS
jgi:glutamine amidotransferase